MRVSGNNATLTLPEAVNQAIAAYNSRDWLKAEQLCGLVLNIKADNFVALSLLGIISAQTNRLEEAAAFFSRAVVVQPGNADAYSNLGNALKELKRLDAAVATYDKAISLKPDYAEIYCNRGNALQELKRLEAAVASYDKAISLKPDYAEAYCNCGLALQELKQPQAAVARYDKAIRIKPDYADAYINRGNALQELKQLDAAVASYDKAISLKPDSAEAYNNRGNVLQELKQRDAAVASYDKAISLKPDYAEACSNRGNALRELKQLDAAVASYDKAISLKPDYAEPYSNRGIALTELKQLDAAVANFDTAISLKPDYADAYGNRGNALLELKQLDAAIASYDKAISLKPDSDWILGTAVHAKMSLCNWQNYVSDSLQLKEKVEAHQKVSGSFPILAMYDAPGLQRLSAEIWTLANYPATNLLGAITQKTRRKKIKLGYYSADFYEHPVSYLMAGLFELHDKERFELIGFSFGPGLKDGMRSRVSAAFDQFIDVRFKSDLTVVKLSRELGIDIAIDLGGFTQDSRTGIFAERVAPVQVNCLGYPGTMGTNFIDYIVADKQVIPEKYVDDYSEKIAYLPCFQANDNKKKIADKVFTRQELGLPQSGFVFCCFNNSYKITPGMFDCWARILGDVNGSVLWMIADNQLAKQNLSKEFKARGLDPGRLVFAERMKLPEYLARYKSADLFLDTLPFNAGTTASDALWAGLPVLTCMGRSFAGRMAGSLLTAIDLPELITQSQVEYEALAIDLATNPRKLATIRQRLAENRLTAPLFDTALYAKHIEMAYTAMYERYQSDLPPDHVDVAALGPASNHASHA